MCVFGVLFVVILSLQESLVPTVSHREMLLFDLPLVDLLTSVISYPHQPFCFTPCLSFMICMVFYFGQVSPTDVEEGMRVGVDRTKYSVQIPLPPKIDPTVSEHDPRSCCCCVRRYLRDRRVLPSSVE